MATYGRNVAKNIGCSRQMLRKGPWTAQEDTMLIEYVKKHGEGNWNAIQRHSSLMRCGKSCRLRWANHLRPNLKKEPFSLEEERLIIQLHAKYGNKWARMATQLPGRTDNEIKNYWNTRLKRRLRAGLPIYSLDIINPQNHDQQQLMMSQPNSSPSSDDPSISSMLDHVSVNPLWTLNNPHHHQLNLRGGNNGGVATASFSLPSVFDSLTSTNTAKNGHLIVPAELSQGSCYTGLLGDILNECRAIEDADTPKHNLFVEDDYDRGKSVVGCGLVGDTNVNARQEPLFSFGGLLDDATPGKQCEDTTNGSTRANKSSPDGICPVDDDLSSLLDNFPQTVPVPNWYDEIENDSNGQVSNFINGDEGTTNFQIEAYVYNKVNTSSGGGNRDWNTDFCYWHNMPDICDN